MDHSFQQNTYQLIVATDEIRTYVMLNYANINWTSSTQAGSLFGRGGKQSAVVGFNGGNGTGMYDLPWSKDGNSYKLTQYGSTQVAGRWLARVDEEIEYGGCNNDSVGKSEARKVRHGYRLHRIVHYRYPSTGQTASDNVRRFLTKRYRAVFSNNGRPKTTDRRNNVGL